MKNPSYQDAVNKLKELEEFYHVAYDEALLEAQQGNPQQADISDILVMKWAGVTRALRAIEELRDGK